MEIPNKDVFSYDPIIGCPFDDSAMEMVESDGGFSLGDFVDTFDRPEVGTGRARTFTGSIIALGKGAKYFDGQEFTAVLVRSGGKCYFRTMDQISMNSIMEMN